MMSASSAYTRRSISLIMVIFIISSIELTNGETFKGDVVFSGDPPEEPKGTAGKQITTIEGDLTIQNYDQATFRGYTSFAPFDFLETVTGTVTIKHLSAQKFGFISTLKEIGGDLIMMNNTELNTVDFLWNNVSVNGSIDGRSCPKLCPTYTYLISVDSKYSKLFDQKCFIMPGNVDILEKNLQIGEMKIINGSLICKLANNPKFEDFDSKLADSLGNLISVGNFLLDDCPIPSLSSTFPSLQKVVDRVEIINCEKLVDKKFSNWLYKMEKDTKKMVLENNTNVCLERAHVAEWNSEGMSISKFKACHEIVGDIDLSKTSAVIPGTVRVDGKIFCRDIKGTEFTPKVMNFLKNIKIVTSLEFIRCEPLINFKTLFPNGFPEVGNVTITKCPNFESDVDVLALVNGTSESLNMTDNDKMCFMEAQLRTLFPKSIIKQKDLCGDTCTAVTVSYYNGKMDVYPKMNETCDKMKGSLIFEGQLPPLEDAILFTNIRYLEGLLFLQANKNYNDSSRVFELLPNLRKIDYSSYGNMFAYAEKGCAVFIYEVTEIDHYYMKSLETINCGESKKCICMEKSPEYAKVIQTNGDWPAVMSNQTTVVFYPLNVLYTCDALWTYINFERYVFHMIACFFILVFMDSAFIIWFERGNNKINTALKQLKEEEEENTEQEKGKGKGKNKEKGKKGNKEKEKDKKGKEESMAQSATEQSMEEDSRLKSVEAEAATDDNRIQLTVLLDNDYEADYSIAKAKRKELEELNRKAEIAKKKKEKDAKEKKADDSKNKKKKMNSKEKKVEEPKDQKKKKDSKENKGEEPKDKKKKKDAKK